MSYTSTLSDTASFTITNARHMAAKVATDLKRMQRLYAQPNDSKIAEYETEVIELLKGGYLAQVSYGFQRDGKWINPTLRYTARELAGASVSDDDPGRIRPGADVSGASFGSFLEYSSAWRELSHLERDAIEKRLPWKRVEASEPGVNGYFSSDRTYSSGGRALERASVRSY